MAFSGVRCPCGKTLLEQEVNCRDCGTAQAVAWKLETLEDLKRFTFRFAEVISKNVARGFRLIADRI